MKEKSLKEKGEAAPPCRRAAAVAPEDDRKRRRKEGGGEVSGERVGGSEREMCRVRGCVYIYIFVKITINYPIIYSKLYF